MRLGRVSVGKVIPLNCITSLDIPVDRVLEAAKDKLEGVVIIGWDKDGELYCASTYADGGIVSWLLDECKYRLHQVVKED